MVRNLLSPKCYLTVSIRIPLRSAKSSMKPRPRLTKSAPLDPMRVREHRLTKCKESEPQAR